MADKTAKSKEFEDDIKKELGEKYKIYLKLKDFEERWGGETTGDLIKVLYSCIIRQNNLLNEIDQLRRNPEIQDEGNLNGIKEDLNNSIGEIEIDEEETIKQLRDMYGGIVQVRTVDTAEGEREIPEAIKKVFVKNLKTYLKLAKISYVESKSMIVNLVYSS